MIIISTLLISCVSFTIFKVELSVCIYIYIEADELLPTYVLYCTKFKYGGSDYKAWHALRER